MSHWEFPVTDGGDAEAVAIRAPVERSDGTLVA